VFRQGTSFHTRPSERHRPHAERAAVPGLPGARDTPREGEPAVPPRRQIRPRVAPLAGRASERGEFRVNHYSLRGDHERVIGPRTRPRSRAPTARPSISSALRRRSRPHSAPAARPPHSQPEDAPGRDSRRPSTSAGCYRRLRTLRPGFRFAGRLRAAAALRARFGAAFFVGFGAIFRASSGWQKYHSWPSQSSASYSRTP
jgi:hypothetical protein